MSVVGVPYEKREESSAVYGSTIDIEVDGVEVASGAVGPHPLDAMNGVDMPWAGIGFGIERLAMMARGESNIRRVGRSLAYLNGARLDV